MRSVVGRLNAVDRDAAARAEVAAWVARLGCGVVEVSIGDEALAATKDEAVALVLLDLGLTDRSAYECCRALREHYGEGLPIVLVSQHRMEPSDQVAGPLLGADEYLAKPLNGDVFTAQMRRLLTRAKRSRNGHSVLTPREREVLSLLVAGVSEPEMAERLCITKKTTSTHIEHILAKLGAHSRAQAVAFAFRDGLVESLA